MMGKVSISGAVHHQMVRLSTRNFWSWTTCWPGVSLMPLASRPVNGSCRTWPSRNQHRTSHKPPSTRPAAQIATPAIQTRRGLRMVVPANQEFCLWEPPHAPGGDHDQAGSDGAHPAIAASIGVGCGGDETLTHYCLECSRFVFHR